MSSSAPGGTATKPLHGALFHLLRIGHLSFWLSHLCFWASVKQTTCAFSGNGIRKVSLRVADARNAAVLWNGGKSSGTPSLLRPRLPVSLCVCAIVKAMVLPPATLGVKLPARALAPSPANNNASCWLLGTTSLRGNNEASRGTWMQPGKSAKARSSRAAHPQHCRCTWWSMMAKPSCA